MYRLVVLSVLVTLCCNACRASESNGAASPHLVRLSHANEIWIGNEPGNTHLTRKQCTIVNGHERVRWIAEIVEAAPYNDALMSSLFHPQFVVFVTGKKGIIAAYAVFPESEPSNAILPVAAKKTLQGIKIRYPHTDEFKGLILDRSPVEVFGNSVAKRKRTYFIPGLKD